MRKLLAQTQTRCRVPETGKPKVCNFTKKLDFQQVCVCVWWGGGGGVWGCPPKNSFRDLTEISALQGVKRPTSTLSVALQGGKKITKAGKISEDIFPYQMEKNGGKWGGMGENGGKWGDMRKWGNREIAVIAHGMWVCGGLWQDMVEENGRKIGRNTHFSESHFPHFPGGLPLNSLCKNQLTALTNRKMGIRATHRHSPPRRLLRRLVDKDGAYSKCEWWLEFRFLSSKLVVSITKDLIKSGRPSHTS